MKAINTIKSLLLVDKPIYFSSKQRKIFLSITLFWVIVITLKDYVYRPYVYENNIWDMHIADSSSSFFSVIVGVFFAYSIERKQLFTHLGIVLLSELAFLFYEVVMSYRFDYYDIWATLLGGYPAYLLSGFVLNKMKSL